MDCVLTKTHNVIFYDVTEELKFYAEISNGNFLHFPICYIVFLFNYY